MTQHEHRPNGWDGYYERCKCGAFAGDQKDPETGARYTTFAEWNH